MIEYMTGFALIIMFATLFAGTVAANYGKSKAPKAFVFGALAPVIAVTCIKLFMQ